MCVFTDVIIAGYVLRRCLWRSVNTRSLTLTLRLILSFRLRLGVVGIMSGVAEFLVGGI